jgi:hypothetical protein
MLSPVCYEKDCKDLIGKTANHVILKDKDRQKHLDISRKLWEAKYPNEPFEEGFDDFLHSLENVDDMKHFLKDLFQSG